MNCIPMNERVCDGVLVFGFWFKSFVVAHSPPPDLSLPRLPRTVPAQGKTPEDENFAFDCALLCPVLPHHRLLVLTDSFLDTIKAVAVVLDD